MNLASTIVPKSDQLNADDLIVGPRTILITKLTTTSGEQPVSIHYDGDNGRPYKPGKSMRRVLAMLWGLDGTVYIGRRLSLYRDPHVTWGNDEVGGIRISHASDIGKEPITLMLTVTRGRKKPFRVEPLAPVVPEEPTFDLQALTDVGETKAREGSAPFRVWWKSIPKAAKPALLAKAEGEWKTLAAEADERAKA